MAGDPKTPDERIADALRKLDVERRERADPPDELWDRIAGALAPGDALDGEDALDDVGGAPPPDLWDSIEAEVLALDATSVEAPNDAPALRSLPVRGRRSLPRTLGLVAAVVLVVVALGLVVVGVGQRQGATEPELVAAAVLTGDGLDPGGSATGSAELLRTEEDWEVAIDALGLPTVDPGMYYEAWLLGEGPDDVQSLGAIDADGTFAVPAGLELADFPLVDVSIETIDGDPSHSTKSVLRGRLETR